MSKLKKYSVALAIVICLLCVLLCGSALAEETEETDVITFTETPVYFDGLLSCRGYQAGDEYYVPLEAACAVLGYSADVSYDIENNLMTVEVAGITITAGMEDDYLCANGRYLYLPDGYMEVDGSFIIPAEALAKIFTLDVTLDEELEAISFSTADEEVLASGDEYYDEDDIYWMSRIIMWESGNQPAAGQIGVGNVILNRAGDARFGETIKDVIFQPGQFSVVETEAIYGEPSEMSLACAKLVYEGYNTVGDSLFFQVGRYWGSDMIETTWVTQIGDHNFFI